MLQVLGFGIPGFRVSGSSFEFSASGSGFLGLWTSGLGRGLALEPLWRLRLKGVLAQASWRARITGCCCLRL